VQSDAEATRLALLEALARKAISCLTPDELLMLCAEAASQDDAPPCADLGEGITNEQLAAIQRQVLELATKSILNGTICPDLIPLRAWEAAQDRNGTQIPALSLLHAQIHDSHPGNKTGCLELTLDDPNERDRLLASLPLTLTLSLTGQGSVTLTRALFQQNPTQPFQIYVRGLSLPVNQSEAEAAAARTLRAIHDAHSNHFSHQNLGRLGVSQRGGQLPPPLSFLDPETQEAVPAAEAAEEGGRALRFFTALPPTPAPSSPCAHRPCDSTTAGVAHRSYATRPFGTNTLLWETRQGPNAKYAASLP
jgi:hypothetical protein